MVDWFARTVLHVRDVDASLAFYAKLGFTSPWHHDEAGLRVVAQVERDGCALILSSQWPDKVGKGLVFVSTNTMPAAPILDAFRAEIEARGVVVEDGEWGYRVLVIDDPDGNQLFFNYPS